MHKRSTTQQLSFDRGAAPIISAPSIDLRYGPMPARPLPAGVWEALSAIASAAADEEGFPRALAEALAGIVRAIGAQAGAIFLADDKSARLALAAHY